MSNRKREKKIEVESLLARLGFRTIEEAIRALERLDGPPGDPLLSLVHKRDLAGLLGVNPWTLDQWRKNGRMPQPIVLSPQIVAWRRSDIVQWLARLEAAPLARRKPNEGIRRGPVISTSTGISVEDPTTWELAHGGALHSLREVLERAFAVVSRIPELQ